MYSHRTRKHIKARPIGHIANCLHKYDPVIQRILSSRGVSKETELDTHLKALPSPWVLSGMDNMVAQLVAAFKQQQKMTIVADFDADGATSCAVAVRGLKMMGAQHVDFVVPDRFIYGYGLTPEIVDLVKQQNADVIITVDNGISSIEGVKTASQAGIKVLVTDHHLPGEVLPEAEAIVNPNLPEDVFPSKHLAGVGVIFYVLMALRSRLREEHWFAEQNISEPNLAQLLDLVALGTVADVVSLDHINRILVHQGLQRIRAGQCVPGILALIDRAGRNYQHLVASDLGFSVAPRLNAAGRMDNMSLGIQCLLSEDMDFCKRSAQDLDDLNQDRKAVEAQMKREAHQILSEMAVLNEKQVPAGVCIYHQDWHQGVIGILASRVKDKIHRPVIAFAKTDDDEIKGSARSIPGVHIRDVLSEIAAMHPELLTKFGGHAMAAGLSIKMHDYPHFALLFDEVVSNRLDQVDLQQTAWTDGELQQSHFNLPFAEQLKQIAVWGQSFPEPVFHAEFDVIQCRIVGQQHLKFVLRLPFDNTLVDAIAFFVEKPETLLGCRRLTAVFKLDINEFRGNRDLQLLIDYFEVNDAS